MAAEGETVAQLEARHEAEEEELEEKARAHLESVKASAGKGKKAKAAVEAAEREIEQWRYELSERQKEEREELEEGAGAAADTAAAADAPASARPVAAAAVAAAQDAAPTEEEQAARKKDKALRKRQNKANKEREREEELEREKLSAGPSRRTMESLAIGSQLKKQKPPLKVLEVLGDGHCLYRSVADQIRRVRPDLYTWTKAPDLAHEEMRLVCAKALRDRRDTYEPFAELAEGEDFPSYCRRVERSADWGGELELRALADELRARILVFRADAAEPLVVGEDRGHGEPLRVTYHQHWYALGEHYNSVVPQDGEE